MSRVLMLVEGPSEDEFVKAVLAPWMSQKGIYLLPTILETREVLDGPNFKGGDVRFAKVAREMRLLLGDSNARLVTSLLDYYGFKDEGVVGAPNPGIDEIETALAERLNSPRALPYLQRYEFEALLFSAPEAAAQALALPTIADRMRAVLAEFGSPEEINKSRDGHPSRRIAAMMPGYRKIADGVAIARQTSIDVMLAHCPRFAGWVHKIIARCI